MKRPQPFFRPKTAKPRDRGYEGPANIRLGSNAFLSRNPDSQINQPIEPEEQAFRMIAHPLLLQWLRQS